MKRAMIKYTLLPIEGNGFTVNLIDITKDSFWSANGKTFFRTVNMRESIELKNTLSDVMIAYDTPYKMVNIRSTTDILIEYQNKKK